MVGPVLVPGGGGQVLEAGGGVYSARAATGKTWDPSKCSCQTPGKRRQWPDDTIFNANDGDSATSLIKVEVLHQSKMVFFFATLRES